MCVCVRLCAFPPLRLLIASWMIWCDMDPVWLVKQVDTFYVPAVFGIVSRCGFRIKACHRNQHSKSKLMLYSTLL